MRLGGKRVVQKQSHGDTKESHIANLFVNGVSSKHTGGSGKHVGACERGERVRRALVEKRV